MRKDRITEGTGITQRQKIVTTAESDEEIRQMMSSNSGPSENYLDYLVRLEKQASKYLASKGLPSEIAGYYQAEDGAWIKGFKPGVTCYAFDAAILKVEKHAPDSIAGYSARFLRFAQKIRAATKSADIERAMIAAHDLGALVTEYKFKRNWEKSAIAGRKSITHGRLGGKNKRAAYLPRNNEMARLYLARLAENPRLKEADTKAEIGKSFGLKRTAAIDAINSVIEKKVRDPAKPD